MMSRLMEFSMTESTFSHLPDAAMDNGINRINNMASLFR